MYNNGEFGDVLSSHVVISNSVFQHVFMMCIFSAWVNVNNSLVLANIHMDHMCSIYVFVQLNCFLAAKFCGKLLNFGPSCIYVSNRENHFLNLNPYPTPTLPSYSDHFNL